MIQSTKENLKAIGKKDACLKDVQLTADANYHTNQNIQFCEAENIDAYIPDVNYRNRDERFDDLKRFKNGLNKRPKKKEHHFEKSHLKDFNYDELNDCFICQQGHRLKLETSHMLNRNITYRVYRIKDDSCLNCPVRQQGKSKHSMDLVLSDPQYREDCPQ